jgi:tetratricopeptide (TPR) repeat protein
VLSRQGQLNEALESYYRSLSYDSQNAETLLAVAETYQKLDRPNRTLATLSRWDSQFVGDIPPQRMWVLKGLAQQRLHRYDEALESLARACQQHPPSAQLLGKLAQIQWQLGQQAAAEQTLRDAFVVASPEEQTSLRHLMARMAQLPDGPPARVTR